MSRTTWERESKVWPSAAARRSQMSAADDDALPAAAAALCAHEVDAGCLGRHGVVCEDVEDLSRGARDVLRAREDASPKEEREA